MQTAFILSVECVGKEYRVFCGVAIEFFFVLGEVLVAAVAYAIGDWRKTILCLMVPAVITLLYWPLLPESPRWLVSRKKFVEAQKMISRMAKYNRTGDVQIADYRESVPAADSNPPSESVLDWLRSPRLVLRSLNLCFSWIVITMAYYGLSMSSASLAGSPYLNFLLVSLVEVPGYALAYLGMQRLGRRPIMSASLIIGGIACIVSPAMKPGSWLNIACFLIGKMVKMCIFCKAGCIFWR